MPSSRFLAKTIIADIGLEKASAIAELGPGTGAFTRSIAKAKNPEAHFFAVELNQDIFNHFQEEFPDIKVYNGCASDLVAMMEREGVSALDVVVSGLPWASFPAGIQMEIIDSIHDALAEDGVFTTFAYLQGFLLPAAHRFRALLKRKFKIVETSKVVWRNTPPAFVYRCWK